MNASRAHQAEACRRAPSSGCACPALSGGGAAQRHGDRRAARTPAGNGQKLHLRPRRQQSPRRSRSPTGAAARGAARQQAEATAQVGRRRSVLAVGDVPPASGARSTSRPLCARGPAATVSRRSAQTSHATTQSATAESASAASKTAGRAALGPRSALSSITSGRLPRQTTPRLPAEQRSESPILLIMTHITMRRIIRYSCPRGRSAGLTCLPDSVRARVWPRSGCPREQCSRRPPNAFFLQYTPAPPTPGIICLVDSGVDPSPDTTPVLAGSYALSPDTDINDELAALNPRLPGGHPDGHGTYMAMIAAAPVNGWGMVGLAPTSVRVYNLKALAAGQSTFAFSEYAVAIDRCQALSSSLPITVVNLSLGSSTQPDGSELDTLENYVQSANAHGLSVIAAAGNEDGPVQAPASLQGVLGVGASDANPANKGVCARLAIAGRSCWSWRLVAAVRPGRKEEGAASKSRLATMVYPLGLNGSSDAGEIVSAAEASMRAYSPTLTYAQAQGCITSTLTNGGNLDVAAAFDACGLERIVNEGMAVYRAANSLPLTTQNVADRQRRPCPAQTIRREAEDHQDHLQEHRLGSRSPVSQRACGCGCLCRSRRAWTVAYDRTGHDHAHHHDTSRERGIGSSPDSSTGKPSSQR